MLTKKCSPLGGELYEGREHYILGAGVVVVTAFVVHYCTIPGPSHSAWYIAGLN